MSFFKKILKPIDEDISKCEEEFPNSPIQQEEVEALEESLRSMRTVLDETKDYLMQVSECPSSCKLVVCEKLDDVITNSKKMEEVLERLKFSHPGVENVHFEKVDIKFLLSKLIHEYQNSRARGVRIYEMNYTANDNLMICDKEKMFQSVNHLLNNSTKNTYKGMIILQITDSDHEWMISVKDSGNGIDPQQLDLLFNEAEEKGTGLSFVKKNVELHMGRVQVSSMPGKRTLFTLAIPKNIPLGKFSVPVDKHGKVLPKASFCLSGKRI